MQSMFWGFYQLLAVSIINLVLVMVCETVSKDAVLSGLLAESVSLLTV